MKLISLILKLLKKARKYEKWTKRMEKEFADVKVSDISKESVEIGKKYLYMLDK